MDTKKLFFALALSQVKSSHMAAEEVEEEEEADCMTHVLARCSLALCDPHNGKTIRKRVRWPQASKLLDAAAVAAPDYLLEVNDNSSQ